MKKYKLLPKWLAIILIFLLGYAALISVYQLVLVLISIKSAINTSILIGQGLFSAVVLFISYKGLRFLISYVKEYKKLPLK